MPKGCPCKQQQADRQPAITSNAADEMRSASQRWATAWANADSFFQVAVWTDPARVELRPRHEAFVRSGRAILTAHHVLTC